MSKVDEKSAGTQELRGVLPPGTRLRIYELISVLGQGGFGITYLARDTQLDREVAIKEYLPTSLALREDGTMVVPRSTELAEEFIWGRDRFLDEARTLARLGDVPSIVRVFDFLEANGTAYMVMALARGDTLQRRLLRDGPMPAMAIERLLHPLLIGLEEVHATGFLHRDIKPANIILDGRGNPTLIDFGASRAAMAGRTSAMTAIFTPGYAAAEQFTSAAQGPYTDIYGLSSTLYHAITGKVPPSAVDRILDDTCPPLAQLRPMGFPLGLLIGIDAGLSVRVANRPQTIAEWRPILAQAPAMLPRAAATVVLPKYKPAVDAPAPPVLRLGAKRTRWALWAGAAAAFLLVAGMGYLNRSVFVGTAVQSLTAQELTQALDERRKADAAATETRKLEEQARRIADADATAKQAADVELANAKDQRQRAEDKLAKLKADMEARRKAETVRRELAAVAAQSALDEASRRNKAELEVAAVRQRDEDAKQKAVADAAARQAADEAVQLKAEAEAAVLRQAEEVAQKRAASEADAKQRADNALAKAQTERQQAEDAAAKQKAEAEEKAKADVNAKVAANAKADVDAMAKAEADAAAQKKAAESAENALRLTLLDRQHVQVALSAQGLDTHGSDGVFGPRTREMIAGWQTTRSQPVTGFLNAAQQQALLKEAAVAVSKYDDTEEEKRKAEEEIKRKADEEAKAREAAKIQRQTEAALDGLASKRTVPGAERSITLAPAAPPVAAPPILIPPATDPSRIFRKTTSRGVEVFVSMHGNWGRNCEQGAMPKVDVRTPPSNGKVVIRPVNGTPSDCAKPVSETGIYYVPNPGFVGMDSFVYDRREDRSADFKIAGARYVIVEVRP